MFLIFGIDVNIINGHKIMTILFGLCNIYKVCFIKTDSYITQMLKQ